ncbi:hypothetical protein Vretimale_15503 [Volvox reticuliferus]|uniref:Uncharacterized protein n=1 Tax=Volvox reticuliferus TaxID=1737510 RepID=A0A8J4FU18_9CHLO|nr:hypothetical protein Vretifemale_15110 [Volvox reticuliferus]GIM12128.1 hypothetical protein Vretimale_15503 [Volvox reticuliferus]
MLACESPDAGRKLEELQRALERSQAFLADLEVRHPKHVEKEECATDVVGCCEDDEVQEEEPQSTMKSSGGLENLKTKLTQWFSRQNPPAALKKSETALPPPRSSFSRVNIEFPSDGTSADTLALSNRLFSTSLLSPTSQQSRLQRSCAVIPSSTRAMSFTAPSLSTSMNSSIPNTLLSSSSATSPIQAPVMTILLPKPHSEASAVAANLSRRSSLGDIGHSRSQSHISPMAAALQQQRRTIFRDTVWITCPDILPTTSCPSAVSSMVQNSHMSDTGAALTATSSPTEAMSIPSRAISRDGGVTSCTGSPIGNIRDRMLSDAQLSMLPPLHGASKPQRVLSLGGDPHPTTRLEQGLNTLQVKSFTLGSTQVTRTSVRGVSVHESGSEDMSRYMTGSPNLRASSWVDRGGFPGVATSVGKPEPEGELSLALSDRARIKQQKQQLAIQQTGGQFVYQDSVHRLQRLAGIPEVEIRRIASARKPNVRSNSGHSTVHFVGASPAVLAAAAAGEAANQFRRQTCANNEVFIPDPPANRS